MQKLSLNSETLRGLGLDANGGMASYDDASWCVITCIGTNSEPVEEPAEPVCCECTEAQ
jgi:hypothetical protein